MQQHKDCQNIGEPDQKNTQLEKQNYTGREEKNGDLTTVAGIPSNNFNVFQKGKIKVHQHVLLKKRNSISTTVISQL